MSLSPDQQEEVLEIAEAVTDGLKLGKRWIALLVVACAVVGSGTGVIGSAAIKRETIEHVADERIGLKVAPQLREMQTILNHRGDIIAQSEIRSRAARDARDELSRRISAITSRLESIHGELRLGRQLLCRIGRQEDPGFECPKVKE